MYSGVFIRVYILSVNYSTKIKARNVENYRLSLICLLSHEKLDVSNSIIGLIGFSILRMFSSSLIASHE